MAALALQPQHRWTAPAAGSAGKTLADTASPTYLASDAIGAARDAALEDNAALVAAPGAGERCDAGKPYAEMKAKCVGGLVFPYDPVQALASAQSAWWGYATLDLPAIAATAARLVGGGGFTFAAEVHVAATPQAGASVALFRFADAAGANSVSLEFGIAGSQAEQLAGRGRATRATFSVIHNNMRGAVEVWSFLEGCGSAPVSNASATNLVPEFCHVAATATGHGGASLALYRNGGLVQDGVHPNPRDAGEAFVPNALVPYTTGLLGAGHGAGTPLGDYFSGAVRAARIYRRALPPAGVRRLVTAAGFTLPTAHPTQPPPPPLTTQAPTQFPTALVELPGWSSDLYVGMVFGILAFIVFGVTVFLLVSPCIQLIEGGSGGPPDVDASYYIYSPSILTF